MSLNRVEQTDLETFLFIEPNLNVPFGGDGQETPIWKVRKIKKSIPS